MTGEKRKRQTDAEKPTDDDEGTVLPSKDVSDGSSSGDDDDDGSSSSTSSVYSELDESRDSSQDDEYEYDSSDEEDIRNTIGNIPVNWYDEHDHLGYDLDGKKIRKPKRGDELDHFLAKMDDPEYGVTVRDPSTGRDVVLTDRDVATIRRLRGAKVPDPDHRDDDWIDWFSSEPLPTPLRAVPESKKSFLPRGVDAGDKTVISRMVHSIKMGWTKPRKTESPETNKQFYMMWKTDDRAEVSAGIKDAIPAPKMRLPGHSESYNPPPEYVMTDGEVERWRSTEPHRRKVDFLPRKYDSLRKVPLYGNFINERFERCLDLYLAPRARKMRLTIQPEDLVPQLPQPKDLQPFPQVCALTFKGHKNMVRSLAVELPRGQFFASGSDDGTVRVWEIRTGYCIKTFRFGSNVVVNNVSWCPNGSVSLLAVAVENRVVLLNAGVGDKVVIDLTEELLRGVDANDELNADYVPPERVKAAVTWQTPEVGREEANVNKPSTILIPWEALVVLKVFRSVKQAQWHAKGDYFATVCPDGLNRSVLVHQLSKRRSQIPFGKSKGLVQCVSFHPYKPYLFVATQRHVRIYDLAKQELAKKLMTGARWISSIDIHPKGDNLLVGTFDKRVQWFDLDLSTTPYQVLRYHVGAVRSVGYHSRYPLFATSSDDGNIVVSHGMVYNDLLQNPLIVPVKFLKGHARYDGFGVMSVVWHPTQPWLLSAGADGHVKLWT